MPVPDVAQLMEPDLVKTRATPPARRRSGRLLRPGRDARDDRNGDRTDHAAACRDRRRRHRDAPRRLQDRDPAGDRQGAARTVVRDALRDATDP